MPQTARKSVEWRYLLGTLSPEEETRVEESFIADDHKFEELELAEDELIDAYVSNELTPAERRQFETKLLTTTRVAERVSFARILADKVGPPSHLTLDDRAPVFAVPKLKWWDGLFGLKSPFPTALAASVLLFVVGGGFLLFSWFQLRGESNKLNAERIAVQRQKEENEKLLREQRAGNEQTTADLQRKAALLEQELARLKAQPIENRSTPPGLPRSIVSLALSPGLRDPSGQRQLTIAAGVTAVELQLPLGSHDYRNYQVIITKARSSAVHTSAGLTPRAGRQLRLVVPAKKLAPGNYIVTVKGRLPDGTFEDVENYVFRINK